MMTVPPDNLAALQETDIFLASFPRSGNTWMRYLLSDVILQLNRFQTDTELPFSIGEIIPDVYVDDVSKCPDSRLISIPRLIKTHQYYESEQKPQRIIYLFRDPADALCSYYHYKRRDGDLMDWATEGLYSFCLDILPMYQKHLASHIQAQQERPHQILFISYERLNQSPFQTLQRVLRFCQVQVSPEVCWRAVENHLFSKHQSHEKKNLTEAFSLPFFRKGKVGGGRSELNAAAIALLEQEALPLYQQALQWEQQNWAGTDSTDDTTLTALPQRSQECDALEALCEIPPPLPGESLEQPELWANNAHYGQATVLKQYAGLPADQPLKVLISELAATSFAIPEFASAFPQVAKILRLARLEDFLNLPSESIADQADQLEAVLPTWLYFNDTARQYYQEWLQQRGDRKVLVPSAAPFVYLAELLKGQPHPARQGTLILPPQFASDTTPGSDWEGLAERLLQLNEEFQPVAVCLHDREVRLGRHIPLLQRGVQVVSAGPAQDSQFLFRLHDLLSRSRFVAASPVTPPAIAPLVYALWLGCAYLDLDTLERVESTTQQQWAGDCLGVSYLQSPDALRQTLQTAAESYNLTASLLNAGAAERQELWEQLRRSQAKRLQQYQERQALHRHIDEQAWLIQQQSQHIEAQAQQLQSQHQHIEAQAQQLQAQHQHIEAQAQQLQSQHHRQAQISPIETGTEMHGPSSPPSEATPPEATPPDAEVRSLRQQLEQSRATAMDLQQRLKQTQDQMEAMTSSKFWKLRQFWFRLKQWHRTEEPS